MQMNKAWFISSMTEFIELKKENDEFIGRVYDLFGASMVDVIGQHDYESFALSLITKGIGDSDWLEYFVYECGCSFDKFNLRVEGANINCIGDLYDWIQEGRTI